LIFNVSGKVMSKFSQNPELGQKVWNAQNSDLANQSCFRQP
jgi:hypothetical protein